MVVSGEFMMMELSGVCMIKKKRELFSLCITKSSVCLTCETNKLRLDTYRCTRGTTAKLGKNLTQAAEKSSHRCSPQSAVALIRSLEHVYSLLEKMSRVSVAE